MRQPEHYPIAPQLIQAAMAMGLPPGRLLRRAGLSPALLDPGHRGVTSAQFFDLWHAAEAEARRPGLALDLGRAMAKGPMVPAIHAFASSPDIETGFQRLALFKPLVAPIDVDAERTESGLRLRWRPLPPGTPMPPLLALFELVFFLECCRNLTATPIVPVALGLPHDSRIDPKLRAFFGPSPGRTDHTEMVLSLADAARPMVFANEDQYRLIESALRRQLADRNAATITDRVRRALVDLLPGGEASVDTVCTRLALSRRSLQRKLHAEGTSFQALLDQTRAELSLHYLARPDLSVQEIAFLLAYRDPNSFYRAFHGWTGMTPGEARLQVES